MIRTNFFRFWTIFYDFSYLRIEEVIVDEISLIYGPTQVKSRLLSSSIFDAMNFQHFSEMLEHNLKIFDKIRNSHHFSVSNL